MFIGAIRRPSRGLLLPGGRPTIDWFNPLTSGLIGCWVVTAEGGANPVIRDLVRFTKMVQAGTGQSIVAGPIGMEARDVTNAGWSVTTALSQRPTTAFTALWMGRLTGSPGINNPTLFGGLYNVPLGAPFVTAGIFRSSTTTTTAGVNYNNGTIQQPTFANAFASGGSGLNCLVGSVALGGTVYLWNAGRLIGSSAAVSGTMSYGANPTIGSGFQASSAATPNGATTCLGFLWNRQLSPAESALISADPTNFLVLPGDLLTGLLVGRIGGHAYIQAISSTIAAPATLIRQAGLVRANTVTAPATLIRQTAHFITRAITAPASLLTAASHALTLSNAATAPGALLRQTGKPLIKAVTVPATLTTGGSFFRTLTNTVSAPATLLFSLGRTLSNTVTSVASAIAALAFTRTLTNTATVPAALIRQTGKTLAATITAPGALLRQIAVLLTNAASTPATLIIGRAFGRVLANTITSIASLTVARALNRTLSAVTAPVASLIRSSGKSIASSVVMLARLTRSSGRLLANSTDPTASVSMAKTSHISLLIAATVIAVPILTMLRVLLAVVSVPASLHRRTAKTLAHTVIVVTSGQWIPSNLVVALRRVAGAARIARVATAVRIALAALAARVGASRTAIRLQAVRTANRIVSAPAMSTQNPVVLDVMRDGTADTRGLDLYPALRIENDTVATISGITVVRADGLTPGVNDLTITPPGKSAPWISSNADGKPNAAINWWQGVGANIAADDDVSYVITVAFITAAGRDLEYDASQIVSATIG